MGDAALSLVEPNEVKERALTIIEQANAIIIRDSEEYKSAGELWKAIKGLKEQVNETFKPIIEKAHAAHREALAQKAKIFDPLDAASRTVKTVMERYDRDQESLRLLEEKRLREEARKAEEERLLMEAIAAEAAGEKEEAKAIMEEPVYVPPIIVPKATPKLNGGPVYRTIWKFRIKDMNAIPRQYMIPNEVAIGGVVRSLKNQANIPGIEVYEERV